MPVQVSRMLKRLRVHGALAAELEYRSVVNQPVDHGLCSHGVGKDLRPLLEREVGRNGNARAFVPLRDNLEENIGGFALEGHVSEFIELC